MRSSDIDEINEVAQSFERLPDRPNGRFVRRPVDPELAKAKQRLRTRVWRLNNDRLGRPTSEQIGSALLLAFCTSQHFEKLMQEELSVIQVAVNDMIDRGFQRKQIEAVMRKVRRQHVGPMDDASEATVPTSDGTE